MKLIYHSNDYKQSESPFDREIVSMACDNEILIVCPYIGLSYIKRIIKIAKNWRLITDMQEWILSNKSHTKRVGISDFISKYNEQIKHIGKVHAKVIISQNTALIGSANFTDNGIKDNTEMSVLINEEENISELKKWFNSLWEIGLCYSQEQLQEFIENNIQSIKMQTNIVRLNNSSNKFNRNARLINIEDIIHKADTSEAQLIACMKKYNKNEEWWNRYFDFIKNAFDYFQIENGSSKIAMTTTKNFHMPINVGGRYILLSEKNNRIGLIMPLNYGDVLNNYEIKIDDRYFFRNHKREAWWCTFKENIIFTDNGEITEMWLFAIKDELERTQKTGYKKYHNPFYYKIVMDLEYRKYILNKI